MNWDTISFALGAMFGACGGILIMALMITSSRSDKEFGDVDGLDHVKQYINPIE